MEKKVLLALDDSLHSRQALTYAAAVSNLVSPLSYTLFNVQPTVSGYLIDEARRSVIANRELKKRREKDREAAILLLERHRDQMIRLGIDSTRIEIITQPRIQGIAKDIIDRAQEGLYDAVIVGRRGVSFLKKALMGSITAKIIDHSSVIPVWVVDGEITPMRILLAVDGSENSLKAVDHLSFMIGGNTGAEVTLFHVDTKGTEYCEIKFDETDSDTVTYFAERERACFDDFYARAMKMFRDQGIGEDRIRVRKASRSGEIGKIILQEARRGGYGTVVLGRRGLNRAFFMGSVSKTVVEKAENLAIWLVS